MSIFTGLVNASQNFSDSMLQTVLPLPLSLVVLFLLLLSLIVLLLLLCLAVLLRLRTAVLELADPRPQSNIPINYQVDYLMTLLDDDQVCTLCRHQGNPSREM
ncbi:hypothetical protein LTS15_004034 [Exophiala xenobiotica]|nr:hypothetical protein LTS15_004034 [Exophiala xenobiotica]